MNMSSCKRKATKGALCFTCTGPPPSSSSSWDPRIAQAPISSVPESAPCLRDISSLHWEQWGTAWATVKVKSTVRPFSALSKLASLLFSPHVDDVSLPSSEAVVIEDDVAVSSVELPVCGRVHLRLVGPLNTPDLSRKTSLGTITFVSNGLHGKWTAFVKCFSSLYDFLKCFYD